MEILQTSRRNINKICHGAYDRFWGESISTSSKAISFNKYKTNICLDAYLFRTLNPKHRIALSRVRLSNHPLWIEKGRHVKPIIDKEKRFCDLCKTEIEDEQHFLLICPLYNPKILILENACRKGCSRYDSLNNEQKIIFIIMSNKNEDILKALSKFIFNSMSLRAFFYFRPLIK